MTAFTARSPLPAPRPGWDDQLIAYACGERSWPMVHPTLRAYPWPLEWILALPPSSADSNALVRTPPERCVITGVFVDMHSGVRCARCASALTPSAAGLPCPEDVPTCQSCRELVLQLFHEAQRGGTAGSAPP